MKRKEFRVKKILKVITYKLLISSYKKGFRLFYAEAFFLLIVWIRNIDKTGKRSVHNE